MVKIQGVDPIMVERLREKKRKSIIEIDQTKRIENRDSEGREQKDTKQYKKKLMDSLARLNHRLEELNAPIRFHKAQRKGYVIIQVINIVNETVISEVLPEKIFQLIIDIDALKGFVVDDLK